MKPYFKILLLLLVAVNVANAQRKRVYNQSFETNRATTAIFNVSNTPINIQDSQDGKMHFDYVLEFEGYSKKEIDETLAALDVKATTFENHITLISKSDSKLGQRSYLFDSDENLVLQFNSETAKTEQILRKSTDSIISEINKGGAFDSLKSFDFIGKHFKFKDKHGNLKKIGKEAVKIIRSYFVVKIPFYVNLKINAKDAQILILDDMTNELSVVLDQGTFTSKKLINPYNSVKIENASFRAYSIVGGNYDFNTVNEGLIGSLENVTLHSEFSKLQLGEIREKVNIRDYNSAYWFYNWSTDFKRFDLISEYSKIHMFYPENNDFSFKVVGNNTVSQLNNMSINMQPNSKGEKFNMMERKPNGKGKFAGTINFDIIHGIIYTHDDEITKTNN